MIALLLSWSALVWLAPFLFDALGFSLPWWPGPVTWLLVGAAIYVLSGVHIVNQWDRLPVMRLGRYAYTADAGVQWIEPLLKRALDAVPINDISEQMTFENIPTHDNVRLTVVVNLVHRVLEVGVRAYTVEVEEPDQALDARARSAVAETVAGQTLDLVLATRATVSEQIKTLLIGKVQQWGFDIRAVEIVDLKIADAEIERAMAMKARAEKEAQAELRRAQMQVEIAGNLKDAAHVMDDAAWRLKGLETLMELTRSAQNNTVLVPTELLGSLTALGIKPSS